MEAKFLLIIRSTFYQVTIPRSEAYAIYTNDYFLDTEGNVFSETENYDVYEYGDIIIQISSSRYIFKKVYAAHDYAVRIMEFIKDYQEDKAIYIDLANLNKNWVNHSDSFEVELLK